MLPSSDILCVNKNATFYKKNVAFLFLYFTQTRSYLYYLLFMVSSNAFRTSSLWLVIIRTAYCPFVKNQPILNPADLLRFIGLQQIIPILLMLCQAFFLPHPHLPYLSRQSLQFHLLCVHPKNSLQNNCPLFIVHVRNMGKLIFCIFSALLALSISGRSGSAASIAVRRSYILTEPDVFFFAPHPHTSPAWSAPAEVSNPFFVFSSVIWPPQFLLY